ncbi:SusD/RagB family nutrient-binding outer membrane lipoprotein [Mariniflexile litorale]|uniref:SusD/RagB family nutrient-binding outer membrane lipoprotein n=1 Tax=Mariniflexile litorale TaxID=3045158 RepID=A0AAU7EBK2_9FLAO|nr:SusD/RagB family nutrient-binding outer membrane lipoprotein [Mariniflexile sp. KMM 9835]MDQ8212522.1 SusD/RagB family nutrient-binding outer membrane lipoprotein [Mariniflexile sp. KMM 9835]
MKNINKKIFNLSIILLLSITTNSCSDYLDVNTDPDSPSDSQITEDVILPGILAQLSYELAGGYPARAASLWTQQIASSGITRDISTLYIDDSDTNNTWQYTIYTGVLKDAANMVSKAEANENEQYIGIGKVVQAYTVAILADFWDEAPWSEAFNPAILKPKFDNQEALYTAIDQLLNEANTHLTNAINSGLIVKKDLLYNGSLTKWKKLANSLRARYALRLIYAKGNGQADLALSYLSDGFASNSDDAGFAFEDKEDANNPWAQWEDKWQIVYINKFMVDLLNSNSDPRLDAYALTQEDDLIVGAENGVTIQVNSKSSVSNVKAEGTLSGAGYFIKNTSKVDMMTYSELLFIAAEAHAFKSAFPTAQTFLRNAVKANLEKVVANGAIILTPTEITDFTNTLVLPVNLEDAQKMIIEQKYIANFLQIETYNDYRRTGYPVIPLPLVTFADQIPERFPYSTDPLLNNTDNVPDIDHETDKVWWDQK